jgi:hypothetical protein
MIPLNEQRATGDYTKLKAMQLPLAVIALDAPLNQAVELVIKKVLHPDFWPQYSWAQFQNEAIQMCFISPEVDLKEFVSTLDYPGLAVLKDCFSLKRAMPYCPIKTFNPLDLNSISAYTLGIFTLQQLALVVGVHIESTPTGFVPPERNRETYHEVYINFFTKYYKDLDEISLLLKLRIRKNELPIKKPKIRKKTYTIKDKVLCWYNRGFNTFDIIIILGANPRTVKESMKALGIKDKAKRKSLNTKLVECQAKGYTIQQASFSTRVPIKAIKCFGLLWP